MLALIRLGIHEHNQEPNVIAIATKYQPSKRARYNTNEYK
jgi:hypothetical protein